MEGLPVTFTTSTVLFDVIKLRKRVDILPVRVIFGYDWDRRTQESSFKDRMFNGEFQIDHHTAFGPLAVYRKFLQAPGVGRIDLRAGIALQGFRGEQWRPFFGIAYNLGSVSDTRLTADGIDFRQKLPLHRRLAFEVCGNVKIPLPAAEYQAGPGDGGHEITVGEGSFALHIAELNPVIYV